MKEFNTRDLNIISIIIIVLILITLLTNFYGYTDVRDYTDASKFFAGKYDAKIRSSHSYLYGLIHTPIVWLTESFLIFKITSLIFLFLIVYSTYYISGKDKRVFWLMLLSPIVWYMAPWMSPIQLSTLLFLWGFYFIKKHDEQKKPKIRNLIYSALLIGLSWAFWDAILFFAPLLAISFLYNKKLLSSIYFTIFFVIGALPRFILDQILFDFALFGVVRHIAASLVLLIFGGFYNQGSTANLTYLILTIIFIPVFTYLIFKKEIFVKNKKTIIFIILSVALLLINSQIRFVLLITPIIFLVIAKNLSKMQFVIQLAISLILILLVVNPYVVQTQYELQGRDYLDGMELGELVRNLRNLEINNEFRQDLISQDLDKITSQYPNEIFVVGNRIDSYQALADVYWGEDVEEFVSIQDYKLELLEDNTIISREFCSNTNIRNRRDLCFSASIVKKISDPTDYDSIQYAISEESELDLEDFILVKKYSYLSLFQKV